MEEVWKDWKQSSKSLAQRLKSDPKSFILTAGAEFYPVKNPSEAWFGWALGSGSKHKCIGIIREAKKAEGIRLLLHLDPKSDLIYDPKEFPNGNGRPFRLSAQNDSDRDRGEILLTQSKFPDQLFGWICCAIRHTAAGRPPKTILPPNVLANLVALEQTALYIKPESLSVTEGKRLLRIHKSIERRRKVVNHKKALVLASTGDLKCEVCRFSFRNAYEEYGEGFAECHHVQPLAEIKGETLTTVDDLAIVCANCHRMLHRPPFPSMDDLRQFFE